MREFDVLVLGGGVAGLAARAALPSAARCGLVEAESELGGLLRVHTEGPYVFDSTTHVLFFRNPAVRQLVEGILPQGMHVVRKENAIWQSGTVIPYPYQFNAAFLPATLRQRCIDEFNARATPTPSSTATFEDWLLAQFGRGFYDAFFRPYNRKLYGVEPSALEAAPLTWMIPADSSEAVLAGADRRVTDDEPASPSAHGFYPRGKRGIAALVDGLLAEGAGSILTGARVVKVRPRERTVSLESGETLRYGKLISTLPLSVLLRALEPGLHFDPHGLSATRLTVVEVGSRDNGEALPGHWTYFPDADIPFYRMVRLERISPDLAPAGAACLLLECQGDHPMERGATLRLLTELGVLSAPRADHYRVRQLSHAYVLFTPGAAERAANAIGKLEGMGIFSAGRFARFQYASIEQSIASGFTAAEMAAKGSEG